ncbi:MAG: Hsp70 family protein [Stackebrandtia sp.]
MSIDYGTSNTVAVLRRADGQVRPLLFGASPLLPSGVYARPGAAELLTGRDAARRAGDDPAGFEPYPKRRIDDGQVLLGGRSIDVPELMAATLAQVRGEAQRVAGAIPSTVVITHPATWGGHRRGLLLDAAARAGFHGPGLVPEPVSASAYFAAMPQVSIGPGEYLAVYDLGAGTFDVTVVRRTDTGFEVVVSEGLDDVGGADLDELVVGQLGMTVSAASPELWRRLLAPESANDRRHLLELREVAKHAKESLTSRTSAELRVPLADRDMHITRAEFEAAAAPLLERTVAMTKAVIGRAGVDAAKLKGLFLVGGASRIPLAATILHRGLGMTPTVLDQPELVVAEGGIAYTDNQAADTTPSATGSAAIGPYAPGPSAAAWPTSGPALSPTADPSPPPTAGSAPTAGPVPASRSASIAGTERGAASPAVQPRIGPRDGAAVEAPSDSRFYATFDLDFGLERRAAVLKAVGIVLLSILILPLAMLAFATAGIDDGPMVAVMLVIMGAGLVAGVVRFVRAPRSFASVGIDVDERGIALRQGAYTVAQPWDHIEAVEFSENARLLIEISDPDFAAVSHSAQGLMILGGIVTAGPIDPEVIGELSTALAHHAGDRFEPPMTAETLS